MRRRFGFSLLLWVWLVITLLVSMATVNIPVSVGTPATVLSAPIIRDTSLTPGSTFYINITVADVEKMWGYNFFLSYETTVLTATGYSSYDPFWFEWPCGMNDDITTVTGEEVGLGDGVEKVFYLEHKPVYAGTDKVYLDLVQTTDYTIDYEAGEITFATAPGYRVAITADYKYPAYVFMAYSMDIGEPVGFSTVEPKPIARIDFTVDAPGTSMLDLTTTEITDIYNIYISHEVVDGHFRNTFLSDIQGPSEPDHLPDGVVDIWDLDFFGLAFGKTSADPDWDEYKIADIRGPVGPDYLPDGVIDIWDLGYCGLEYGKSV